jgi:hypothetical protein
VYLERPVCALREHGITIDEESLTHLSPIGWEHINLTDSSLIPLAGTLNRPLS